MHHIDTIPHPTNLAADPAATEEAAPRGAGAASGRHRRRASRRTPLLDALDREWERLRRRPTAAHVRRWGDLVASADPDVGRRVAARLDLATSLDDVVELTQRGRPDADAVLAELVRLGPAEPLAERTVLQRILPGVVARAGRWHGGGPDVVDEAVSSAWLAIRRLDPDRRSHEVAAVLIADAVWLAFRRSSRRRSAAETTVPCELLVNRPLAGRPKPPLVALAETLREAAVAGVESEHLDVLRSFVATGSLHPMAQRCGVTTRTIRYRREAAIVEVRRHLGLDGEDAAGTDAETARTGPERTCPGTAWDDWDPVSAAA